jgi:phosphoribosylformylglycinamidine synthase
VERIIELEWVDCVSSADTGAFGSGIELNAINVLIQKCKMLLMPFVESDHNPIVSIHDHGAGGLNCLSELVRNRWIN